MIDQAGIRAQALRRYAEYLSLIASGDEDAGFFPVDIRFGKVRSEEAVTRWSDLREELRVLREGSDESGRRSYHIDWEERRTRLAGAQSLPVRLQFPDASSLLAYLGKTGEAARFAQDVKLLRDVLPELRSWAAKKPLRVVENGGDWDRLAYVVQWLRAHPRPRIFAREVPAVEDTKFIERKKGVLRELLDETLPRDAIAWEAADFNERYGLRRIEPVVRVSILDEKIARTRLSGLTDVSVPVCSLNRLLFSEITTVIVFENKASFANADAFLSLPSLRGCAAIFGSGFAVGSIRAAAELNDREILYWGDIDTQGFQILSLVREKFPRCRSILMDEETFDQFPEYRTDAPSTKVEDPRALTPEELSLYHRLSRLPKQNRLEQERIPIRWARERLSEAER